MEENENSPEVSDELQTEEVVQESAPTREEILAMSRAENKNGDEMKKGVYKTAAWLSYRVGIVIAIVFSILCLILKTGEELLLPMYSVVMGMIATNIIYIGVKERKKFLLMLAICMIVVVVTFTVLEILMLLGIM